MSDKKKSDSALKVNEGINQPSSVNKNALKRFRKIKRKDLSIEEFVKGIRKGDRTVLSKAITLVESSKPEHSATAQKIIEKCLPYAGKSIRIGITGVPGVGKSTFIEALGSKITTQGHKLAVLAIDPSSERSGGSILGDKTRMESLAGDPNAFIRPSPSAGSLGGVARKTRESVILCEAAGFDTIFIETVGVGQSETAVRSMVDFFLLLMLAGAGDELQGIKRGIMEMADGIAITKADGSNKQKAEMAKVEYANALHLFPLPRSKWSPQVYTCSSMTEEGIENLWNSINHFKAFTVNNGFFKLNRREQARYWMYESINETLKNNFYHNDEIKNILPSMEDDILNSRKSSFMAAKELLDRYFNQ
jgi:LAO/AO transport system kinase